MTKHTLSGVQRPHGTALIAPEHKPPVGISMTYWRVTTDHQRHTPAKPSKVYPEELGLMLSKINKSCKEIFSILPRFLEDLLQSEDLFHSAATRTKTALAILLFWFHYFSAFPFKTFGIYFPLQTK